MPWENIDERLLKAFDTPTSVADGVIAFAPGRLEIDGWLTAIAETDEELRELDVPRIQFLQNRWRFEKLAQFEWKSQNSVTQRTVWAMAVGRRAYILYSGGFKYWLIAAVEPRDKPSLYRTVIEKLLQDPDLVPLPPSRIQLVRPDLIPEINNVRDTRQENKANAVQGGYLSRLLVGWVGPWIDQPVLGYWHHDDL